MSGEFYKEIENSIKDIKVNVDVIYSIIETVLEHYLGETNSDFIIDEINRFVSDRTLINHIRNKFEHERCGFVGRIN